jgi:hypothetical protein
MTVFDLMREQLATALFMVNNVIAGKVSLDRVNEFLKEVRTFVFTFLHRIHLL